MQICFFKHSKRKMAVFTFGPGSPWPVSPMGPGGPAGPTSPLREDNKVTVALMLQCITLY